MFSDFVTDFEFVWKLLRELFTFHWAMESEQHKYNKQWTKQIYLGSKGTLTVCINF